MNHPNDTRAKYMAVLQFYINTPREDVDRIVEGGIQVGCIDTSMLAHLSKSVAIIQAFGSVENAEVNRDNRKIMGLYFERLNLAIWEYKQLEHFKQHGDLTK